MGVSLLQRDPEPSSRPRERRILIEMVRRGEERNFMPPSGKTSKKETAAFSSPPGEPISDEVGEEGREEKNFMQPSGMTS